MIRWQQVGNVDLYVIDHLLRTGRLRRKTPQSLYKRICRTLFQQHGYHGQMPVGIGVHQVEFHGKVLARDCFLAGVVEMELF